MTTPLNPMDREAWEKRLKEIEARTEAATPGPWVKDGNGTGGHIKSMPKPPVLDALGWEKTPTVCIYDIWSRLGVPVPESEELASREEKDGAFIAHARQDIPDLVAYARALQTQLTEALAEVERLMEVVKFYADDDTYHIDILGACGLSNDMDEWGQFGKKAKEAIEAIEKVRQPK